MNLLDQIRGWRNFVDEATVQEFAQKDAIFKYLNYLKLNQLERELRPEEFIKAHNKIYHSFMAESTKNVDLKLESKLLKYFETAAQRSYLVGVKVPENTNLNSVICILDDRKTSSPVIKWKIINGLSDFSSIAKDIKIRPSSKDGFGLIDFGVKHKGWYYSENLFKNLDIRKTISDIYFWVSKVD